MEHDSVNKILNEILPGIDQQRAELLAEYVRLVRRGNSRFNLTGFKTAEEIAENLVAGSIKPLMGSGVPRGTFADIGTGAGTPGIPVAIFFPELRGTLVDSNTKKIRFINDVIQRLNLHSVKAVSTRLETAGRETLEREKYDLVLSRALGNLPIVAELGSPFLKEDGLLYIYSGRSTEDLSRDVIDLCHRLSLEPVDNKKLGTGSGIIFRKTGKLHEKYPRKYPVISREASQISEFRL